MVIATRTVGTRGHVGRALVVVAAVLRPVLADGVRTRERRAGWYLLPNTAGVELLVVDDPLFGELTFVRGDA